MYARLEKRERAHVTCLCIRMSCKSLFVPQLDTKQMLHVTGEFSLSVVSRRDGEFRETNSCCSEVYPLKILQLHIKH